nr:PTS sugar transporter subunit IIA [Heyndrickxia oleronia]
MSMDQKRTVAKEQEADSEKLNTPQPSVVNQSTSLDSVLDIGNIFCNVEAATQDEVFQKLAKISNDHHISNDETSVIKGFVEREKLSTTGMEQGIAIPHTELESINKASIVILKLNQGVDWKALDGQPTNIVIAMFIPKGKANDHLRYLSEVSKLLIHQEFIDQLQHANSSKEIYQLFIENIH